MSGHLIPVLGGQRLSSITAADVRSLAARRLEAKASPVEINRELAFRSTSDPKSVPQWCSAMIVDRPGSGRLWGGAAVG
jgi:hypothetical protein